MKKTALFLCLTAVLIVPFLAFSFECSEIPSAKNIDVKVYTSAEAITNGFKYNYMLTSSQKSAQEVSDFMVEFYSPISNTLAPNGWFGMGTGLTGGSPFAWASDEIENNIKPGESLNGFGMQSKGLPTIVTYYAHGWVEMPVVSEAEAPDKPCPEQNIFIDAVKGKTIGPKDPPSDFKPVEFLDNIISLKKEAYNLGWIIQGKDKDRDEKDKKDKKDNKHEDKEHGIMKSLDKKLDEAREKLVKGDIREATEKLWSFIHEIEALYKECEKDKRDKDKKEKEDYYHDKHHHDHITSEAYALLKYNTHYLIEQLKGEKK